jgi:outer membrane protein TolC
MKAVAVLGAMLLSAAAAGAGELGLAAAQQQLLARNADMVVAQLEMRAKRAGLTESRAAWYPSLDASASYTWMSEKTQTELPFVMGPTGIRPGSTTLTLGDNDKTEFGVDLSYPLFTGLSRWRAVQGKRIALSAQDASNKALANRLSLALGLLYYRWQLSLRQAAVQQALVTQLQDYAAQMKSLQQGGMAAQSRVLEAQSRLELAAVDQIAATDLADSLRSEVLFLIGSSDAAAEPSADTDTVAEALPALALDTMRPELVALSRAVDQNVTASQALFGQRLPAIGGMAGWRYANPGLNMASTDFMNYWLVGLQLKWTLFDGLKNRSQRLQLRTQGEELNVQRRQQMDTWNKDLTLARTQADKAARAIAAGRSSLGAAQELTRELRNAQTAGITTASDYLTAAANEAHAAYLLEQARFSRRVALLSLRYAAGEELRF